MNENDSLKKIISHCKAFGFIFQSSEIYDGLSAVYDYGPLGVELKNNLKTYWWKSMINLERNIVGLDSAIFMDSKTWEASGHVDAFNDPLIDNKDSKKRYRADVLVENYLSKIDSKIQKEISKGEKRFGENFDKEEYVKTNPRVIKYSDQYNKVSTKLANLLSSSDLNGLKKLIDELDIKDPVSGTSNWTDVKQFNLMFSTEVGSNVDNTKKLYLRPETAQGIFVNFLNVVNSTRSKVPFGIAQIGKAFRNEIIARQFIFRMREFEQMEMQFFVRPGTELEWYEKWKEIRLKWHQSLGLGNDLYRFHDHKNLAHYANAACDIEFKFPMGFKELEGIHSRTDFDLKKHQEKSNKKMVYFDQKSGSSFIPYVVETSIGLDRLFLSVLSSCYVEEKLDDGSNRVFLNLPFEISPVKCAVLPLNDKDGLSEKSLDIFDMLKYKFNCQLDSKDSIGKRYRRQDAIGTPLCITVDYDSLEDNSVTVRNRDNMSQERVKVDNLISFIDDKTSLINLLKKSS
jgi:glycyl-tRNA synthetase|tara:strand:+ start:1465 stop:3006 length:1542 start_codon:yes stop_codon:yes gene_type:complete